MQDSAIEEEILGQVKQALTGIERVEQGIDDALKQIAQSTKARDQVEQFLDDLERLHQEAGNRLARQLTERSDAVFSPVEEIVAECGQRLFAVNLLLSDDINIGDSLGESYDELIDSLESGGNDIERASSELSRSFDELGTQADSKASEVFEQSTAGVKELVSRFEERTAYLSEISRSVGEVVSESLKATLENGFTQKTNQLHETWDDIDSALDDFERDVLGKFDSLVSSLRDVAEVVDAIKPALAPAEELD